MLMEIKNRRIPFPITQMNAMWHSDTVEFHYKEDAPSSEAFIAAAAVVMDVRRLSLDRELNTSLSVFETCLSAASSCSRGRTMC